MSGDQDPNIASSDSEELVDALPDLCVLSILGYTDARTVYNFSRCSWASKRFVDENFLRLPRPRLEVWIDQYSKSTIIARLEGKKEERIIDFGAEEGFSDRTQFPATVCEIDGPEVRKTRFIWRFANVPFAVFINEDLELVLKYKERWEVVVHVNLPSLKNSNVLSFAHLMVSNLKPVEINFSSDLFYEDKTFQTRQAVLQFNWKDFGSKRCGRYWERYWKMLDAAVRQLPKYSDTVGGLLLDFLEHIFTDGIRSECKLRFPLITKEVAIEIVRHVVALWPSTNKLICDATLTLIYAVTKDTNKVDPRNCIKNVDWIAYDEGPFRESGLKFRLFHKRPFDLEVDFVEKKFRGTADIVISVTQREPDLYLPKRLMEPD